MTDEERNDEGDEEAIEDLQAPAEAQDDVVGGGCTRHTESWCIVPTCAATKRDCQTASGGEVIHYQ